MLGLKVSHASKRAPQPATLILLNNAMWVRFVQIPCTLNIWIWIFAAIHTYIFVSNSLMCTERDSAIFYAHLMYFVVPLFVLCIISNNKLKFELLSNFQMIKLQYCHAKRGYIYHRDLFSMISNDYGLCIFPFRSLVKSETAHDRRILISVRSGTRRHPTAQYQRDAWV